MGLFSKKKATNILTDADRLELKELQRAAYMEEAKKLVMEKGKAEAKADLGLNTKKNDWDIG